MTKPNKPQDETQLQRVIRRSESGEIAKGTITIRISIYGYSLTRFTTLRRFEKTMDDMKELREIFKVIKENNI